jgi:cell wall assembly regulator SMI1
LRAKSWQAITSWLHAHAPRTHASLAGPAAEGDIRDARAQIPGLPADLVTWWRLCDGATTQDGSSELIPPYFVPCRIREALEAHASLRGFGSAVARERAAADEAGSHAGAFLGSFVPIAASGTGDYLFADLRPGPRHGCVQHWSRDDGCHSGMWWPSTTAMLTDIAAALTDGGEAGRTHVEVAWSRSIRASTYTSNVTAGRLIWHPTHNRP